jgi:ABC transport system ATP-binding/permease protein
LLILQVIFSGLLFEPQGVANFISALTLSRWTLEGLGTTANLNQLLLGAVPGYEWDPAYQATVFHLAQIWVVLGLYAGVCLILACWRQAKKR